MKRKSSLIILFLIVLAGFILRLYQLNKLPLYGDELTMVYDSYSILKTGRDQLGNLLPLTFEMGAGRPAGYVYGAIPFVLIFGPTDLGVRSLSVISGLGLIILAFLLGRKLISEKVGLIAAVVVAISPWDLSLSRGGYEAHFALFLATLGVFLFLKFKENIWFLIGSAICFGLTLHTYPTHKLTLPLFLIILLWYSRKDLFIRKNWIPAISSGLVLLFFVILAISQTLNSGSEERFASINLFADQGLSKEIKFRIGEDKERLQLPFSLDPSYFHNKWIEYGFILTESYLKNLSFDYLFIYGDKNPRHNMVGMGNFYFVEIVTIFFGGIYLTLKQKRLFVLLLGWILITPLATMLFIDTHSLRNAFMLPPFILFSAAGIVYLWTLFSLKYALVVRFLILGFFLLQVVFLAERFYIVSPKKYSRIWSEPAKLASQVALENKNNYKYIVISDKVDNIEFAYPVYTKMDPTLAKAQRSRNANIGKYNFAKYENVYIGYIPDIELISFIESTDKPLMLIVSSFEEKFIKEYWGIDGSDGKRSIVVKKVH
jgi:4-amino-4-deoxy-L-arabinose transferase-like glycosyltransferase